MKIRYSAITALIISTMLCFISCDNPFSREWAAKIGNDVITIKDFNRFYYGYNKMLFGVDSNEEIDKMAQDPVYGQMNQYLNKQSFLELLINYKVVYETTIDDKSIDQDDLNAIIEFTKYNMVVNYYMLKKLKYKIVVTDDEVNEYYTKYKDKLSKYPINEALSMCRKNLEQQKLQYESVKFVEELKQKVGVNRDGFKEYMSKENKK